MLTAKKISNAIAKTSSSSFSKTFSKALLAITVNLASLCALNALTDGSLNTANAVNTDHHSPVTPANIRLARNPSSNLDNRISATLIDDQGRLWLGTWQGLIQIDQRSGTAIASISLPNSTVTALLEDRRG